MRNERRRATLADAARTEPTDVDFLDQLLQQETAAKQRKRIAMGIQIAHGPMVKTLADLELRVPGTGQPVIRARNWPPGRIPV